MVALACALAVPLSASPQHFFRKLLQEHGALLERLSGVLAEEEDGGVERLAPDCNPATLPASPK